MTAASGPSSSGVDLIAAERRRQVEVEGWSAAHDGDHTTEALALAAACYALPPRRRSLPGRVPSFWPWHWTWWKPTPDDRVHELVKAGALIAAEIDRLNGASSAGNQPVVTTSAGGPSQVESPFPLHGWAPTEREDHGQCYVHGSRTHSLDTCRATPALVRLDSASSVPHAATETASAVITADCGHVRACKCRGRWRGRAWAVLDALLTEGWTLQAPLTSARSTADPR